MSISEPATTETAANPPATLFTEMAPLFEPFSLKSLKLKNRIVMAPMTRQHSVGNAPTRENVEYYERRAANDVGLIITEGTPVNRPGKFHYRDVPQFYGDTALAGWGEVAAAVHRSGGRIAPQLWHVGVMPIDPKQNQDPSAQLEGPGTMSLADIEATIAAFGQAAADAKRLGFDAIEVHGAHGYLIDQFFWSFTNQRTDQYGGKTLRERNRFATDVLRAIRAAVGPETVVILRLSQWKQADFTYKLAQTPKEMEEWLLPLAEAGADILHMSQRRFWEPEFDGSDLNTAGWAKKITGLPTITVGSVGLGGDMMSSWAGETAQPQGLAELMRRLDRNEFDLVAVGRALLQDPEWVTKVREGRTGQLRAFSPQSLATYY